MKLRGCIMSKKRRRFTREFKISVINELDAGKTIAQLSREHNLHPTLISRWKREYRENPESAFRGNGKPAESKVAELERLVGQLYAENAFLKKALERLRETEMR
jgi:transposase